MRAGVTRWVPALGADLRKGQTHFFVEILDRRSEPLLPSRSPWRGSILERCSGHERGVRLASTSRAGPDRGPCAMLSQATRLPCGSGHHNGYASVAIDDCSQHDTTFIGTIIASAAVHGG